MSLQKINRNNGGPENKQEVVSITYEEIGLFPRSFSRVLDRFLKQIFSDVENLVIQEYRFYRYLFLTTFKSLLILFFVPFFVNFLAKNYVIRPLTEYFWNTKQTEIFLNSYQQKRAFAELKDFEEKLYFESLIYPKSVCSRGLGASGPLEHMDCLPENSIISSTSESSQQQKTAVGLTLAPEGSLKTSTYEGVKESSRLEEGGTMSADLFLVGDRKGVLTPKAPSPVLAEDSFTGLTDPPGPMAQGLSVGASRKGAIFESPQKAEPIRWEAGGNGSETPRYTKEALSPPKGSRTADEKTESLIYSYTLKSSLFVYQTREADKNIQQRYQEKTIELAQRYNDQSIEAITNFFGDVVSLLTLIYLFYALEIQINITKSFLLEVFFGLDDSKKSLLILLITDLLVGYHSSNLWELFFEFFFHHYGLPESQTGIFLLVATLPVLLDVLFKYLIFRHLNRSSPATVATYHAMIE